MRNVGGGCGWGGVVWQEVGVVRVVVRNVGGRCG